MFKKILKQKATGDIKLKNKPDPYAYIPLNAAKLNKRLNIFYKCFFFICISCTTTTKKKKTVYYKGNNKLYKKKEVKKYNINQQYGFI